MAAPLLSICLDQFPAELKSRLMHSNAISLEPVESLSVAKQNNNRICLCFNPTAGTEIHLLKNNEKTNHGNRPIDADYLLSKWHQRTKTSIGNREPLAKALSLSQYKYTSPPSIIDLTAGLGRDAFNMAHLGCKVHMIEQCTPLVILLEQALSKLDQRSSLSPMDLQTISTTAKRLTIEEADHQTLLVSQTLDNIKPHALYFDPMYPSTKKSALVKKETQVLHALIGEADSNLGWITRLVETKLKALNCRLIIKRHIKAPTILGLPTFQIKAKSIRFDVYQF